MTSPSDPIISLHPVSLTHRIESIDVLRGVALLGILLMNIGGMGLPDDYHHPPTMHGWNLRVWEINELFFEGTMRGLFTMLFGAGVVLFTQRGEKGGGIAVADLYYRRLLWLLGLSLIHGYLLLFHGEVLFYYAWLGLLLFPLRKVQPLALLVMSLLLLLASGLVAIHEYHTLLEKQHRASLAQSLRQKGNLLTNQQKVDLAAWQDELQHASPAPDQLQMDVIQVRSSYPIVFQNNAAKLRFAHTVLFHDYFFFDFLAFILLGMAFFKWGVFQGRLPSQSYWLLLLIGYSVGISVNWYETALVTSGGFSLLAYGQWEQTYQLGRVFTTLGHISFVLLLVKWGQPAFLLRSLAAVGRMALTNYIMHSLVAVFVFTGVGLGLYGQLERYQLVYLVGGIWLFQLVLSPVWLNHFHFGPIEWLWRSLTYWQRQPFKRTDLAE